MRGMALGMVMVAVGCGSSPDVVLEPGEVVGLCDGLIAAFESRCTPEQRQELASIEDRVERFPDGAVMALQGGEAVTVLPVDRAHFYRLHGVTALLQGKLGPGVWASAMAARKAPTDPVALTQLAVMLLEQKRCEEAHRLLETARRGDPGDDVLLRVSLASALTCLGKEGEAAQVLEEAATQAPNSGLVERAVLEFYRTVAGDRWQMPPILAERCDRDLAEALTLATMEDLGNFVARQSQESQSLTMETLALVQRLPADLPEGFVEDLSAVSERYEATARTRFDDPAMQARDGVTLRWSDGVTILTEQEAACCEAQGGHCCSCLEAECTGVMGQMERQVVPESFKALEDYLPGRVRLLQEFERDLLGVLFQAGNGMSSGTMEWAVAYIDGVLAQQCKAFALTVANLMEPPISANLFAGPVCTMPEECRDAERQAQIEEQRLRLGQEREKRAKEAEAKALAAELAVDLSLHFSVCLDGLGCLGVDGSEVFFQLGTEHAFAEFSVDVESYDVGVRAGMGVGDPTGNLWGADLYLGATVGPGGTSVRIGSSESRLMGTRTRDVTLFQKRFRW